MNLNTPLKSIPRITPKYAKTLEKMGLLTVEDLLLYFPFRYDDFSQTVELSEDHIGKTITVSGVVAKAKNNRIFRRRMTIQEVVINDGNNTPLKIVWFNQPYILDSAKIGSEIRVSGKLELKGKNFSMTGPAWEKSSRDTTNTGRLVPIYSETAGITSKWIRWQIKEIFSTLKGHPMSSGTWTSDVQNFLDILPIEIRKKFHLPDIAATVTQLHFPDSKNKLLLAQKRMAFQEMFLVQLKSLQVKAQWEGNNSLKINFDEKLIKDFVDKLPFKLTNAQRKASFEILKDLEKEKPMNRMLEGDVGSGKTIVAAISSLQAISAGYQVAIMAPTEVLARQHFISLSELLRNYNIKIALLTNSYRLVRHPERSIDASRYEVEGSTKKYSEQYSMADSSTSPSTRLSPRSGSARNDGRKKLLEKISSGKINIIIGTHALIQKDVKFKNLALVIIDEQHRFGVAQRASLVSQTYTDFKQTDTENNNLLYENLTYKIRGAIFAVKKQLGLGHKENIYQKALAEELNNLKLFFEKEKTIDIKYNNKKIGIYRPDFVVEHKVILELKALPSIGRFEKQQIWHYLKGSDYKLALLINFGREDVQIERFINTGQQKSVSSPHKSVLVPHLLTMTATPIPRSLAIAFFGSLDLSILDEMPRNRKPIITKIVPPSARKNTYEFIKREITNGRQVFIIFPLVEESKAMTEVKAATEEYEKLKKIFPEFEIGLMHGRLKAKEKEEVMQGFKNKTTRILVSTSVVEVGIDVPNATVMVIENSERFGLSQLHQFRGRVGRGEHQSYCFLFTNSNTKKSIERLEALEKTNDGFEISKIDLEFRGPGQFFGTVQSGLPDIAMENLTNVKLIKFARVEAQNVLKADPKLKKHPLLADALKKFSEKVHLE